MDTYFDRLLPHLNLKAVYDIGITIFTDEKIEEPYDPFYTFI